jgi:hypothetical protein
MIMRGNYYRDKKPSRMVITRFVGTYSPTCDKLEKFVPLIDGRGLLIGGMLCDVGAAASVIGETQNFKF